jgi:hypothetical protein
LQIGPTPDASPLRGFANGIKNRANYGSNKDGDL